MYILIIFWVYNKERTDFKNNKGNSMFEITELKISGELKIAPFASSLAIMIV